MPDIDIRGTVSDRHGIPLRHALRLDTDDLIDGLETQVPATDDFVLSVIDGVLGLSLISDLPSGAATTIFDILSGNAILTVSQPDLAAANVTLTVDETQINHDNLTGFVANEHIDHTSVTLTAGVGLSGGGDISANRTFNLDITELTEDTNPDEAADFLASYDTSAGTHKKILIGNIDHDNLTGFVANEHINHTSVTLTAGVGLAGGGDISASRTFDLDINELTEDTSPDEAADFFATYDVSAAAHKKVKFANVDVAGLTGTLAIGHGGTGQTTQTAAMDALSPTSAKGDLLVDNGTNVVARAVGTNGHVLTADSAEATGVKWALPGGTSTGVWVVKVKTVNQDLTSDSTVNDDADLQFTTVANTNYAIRGMIVFFSTSATPDFKWQVSHSGTTTDILVTSWKLDDGATAIANILGDATGTSDNPILMTANELNIMWFHGFLRVGASGGTFIFRWSQNTSDVTATTVYAGSFIEYLAEAP